MKNSHPLLLAIAALLSASSVRAVDGEDGWIDNFAAAKKLAAKEGKDLLLDFTGSDWCGWCIRLKKEVFNKPAFQREAPKNFVLVTLDYPRSKKLAKKIKEQNDRLQKEFAIAGFPTIILCDAAGRPYAKTGYRRGGATGYLEHLAELRKQKATRDGFFQRAEQASGTARAKILDEALSWLEENELGGPYAYLFDEIIALDPSNDAGLREKYLEIKASKVRQAALDAIEGLLAAAMKDENSTQSLPGILAQLDDFLNKHKPAGELRQKALFFKGVIFNKQDKFEAALKVFAEVQAISSQSRWGTYAANFVRSIEQKNKKKGEASTTKKGNGSDG